MPMLFTVAVAALSVLILVALVACLRDDKSEPVANASVRPQPFVASPAARVVLRPSFQRADASPPLAVLAAAPQARQEDVISELREQIAQLRAEDAALKQEIRDLQFALTSTSPDRQDASRVRLIAARAA